MRTPRSRASPPSKTSAATASAENTKSRGLPPPRSPAVRDPQIPIGALAKRSQYLPAVSSLGGFRAPAPGPVPPSQRARTRNPSPERTFCWPTSGLLYDAKRKFREPKFHRFAIEVPRAHGLARGGAVPNSPTNPERSMTSWWLARARRSSAGTVSTSPCSPSATTPFGQSANKVPPIVWRRYRRSLLTRLATN